MKRCLTVILILVLGVGLLSAPSLAEEKIFEDAASEGAAEEPREDYGEETGYIPPDHLTVGNTTRLQGNFFSEMWGNATSDIDVRDLIHGYNLIRWDNENGMFTVAPNVVNGIAVTQNERGDRTYVLALNEHLYYSDGTRITAWDYAFSFLLSIAPEIYEAGGVPLRREHLLGYQAYIDGDADYLSGVRVLADNSLQITVRGEYLPFFYEFGLLSCNPYPISVIAPDVAVRDDGRGVYLANAIEWPEPIFTGELLRQTLLGDDGYISHPSVVSGPYTLASFDGTTAVFEINPYFSGDVNGNHPAIPRLVYTLVDNETMAAQLTGGEIDLLNKVMREDVIREGMAAIQDGFQMSNYPRDGLSYISFCCERDTVKDKAVRQAIAWCLDRSQLAEDYTAGFGLRVDGYFGIGQWMYGVVNGTIEPPVDPPEDANDQQAQAEYEAALAAYEELSLGHLTQYTVNLDRARALLEGDGWRLNDDGIREKDGVTLDLTLIYPEDNKIGELLDGFIDNLAAVGIQLTLEPMDMNDLLRQWYKQDERDNDMFFLASNFALVFDPSVSFSLNAEGEPNWSYTNHTDAELYHLALEMRRTEPGDVLAYCRRWVAFQERFNDTLPMLPIYSNIYFDFYREDLQNYAITENISWSQAIIPAYFGIPEDNQEDLFEDETWNEDLIAFDD